MENIGRLTDVEKLRIQDLITTVVKEIDADNRGKNLDGSLRDYLEGFVAGFKLAATFGVDNGNKKRQRSNVDSSADG